METTGREPTFSLGDLPRGGEERGAQPDEDLAGDPKHLSIAADHFSTTWLGV
jgi:hypothetical protein